MLPLPVLLFPTAACFTPIAASQLASFQGDGHGVRLCNALAVPSVLCRWATTICHQYFYSCCHHHRINLYRCAALYSEELSGRITDSCYFSGVGQQECTLENHNKRQQWPSVQPPQQPCCDIEQDGGNNQQRTLTWLSSVTSPPSRPSLTPACTQQRRSWATRGPAPPACLPAACTLGQGHLLCQG